MKQHIVFAHQNYPAQFGPISEFLLKHYDVHVSFYTEYASRPPHPGIHHVFYQSAKTGHEETPYFFSRYFEQECASMHGLYEAFEKTKLAPPDVMVGHTAFGTLGLFHVAYPCVPKIGYFELFYDPFKQEPVDRRYPVPLPNRLRIPLRNATQLVELQYCSKGYSPTAYQQSTYPAEYQHKLSVMFDGIDTALYSPGVVSETSELERTWPPGAKIVTYVSRGLEEIRGFDIFMEIAHRVSQKRSDVHFVIAGRAKTHYGSEQIWLKEGQTFKDFVLSKRPFDLSRFHFVEWLSEPALVDLYRLSDCHFYWTRPFTLSWSLFQALSTGALVLASDTAPVRDIIEHEVNGLLMAPQDIEGMVEQMLLMLDQPSQYQHLREQARQRMVEQYSFEVCLPRLAEYYLGKTGAIQSKSAQKALISIH